MTMTAYKYYKKIHDANTKISFQATFNLLKSKSKNKNLLYIKSTKDITTLHSKVNIFKT
jgi:hypothetical protein